MSGVEIKLTKQEYNLLRELVQNADKVLTFSYFLNKAWGPEYADDKELLYGLISSLRGKIDQGYIRTVTGVGYQFTDV